METWWGLPMTVYIVLQGNRCNIKEILAVAKVCNINYLTAKSKFSIEPPYPYDYKKYYRKVRLHE